MRDRTGTGMLRRFGPLLASRYSGKVFTNRKGPGSHNVEVVTAETCLPRERDYLTEALAWIGEVSHG